MMTHVATITNVQLQCIVQEINKYILMLKTIHFINIMSLNLTHLSMACVNNLSILNHKKLEIMETTKIESLEETIARIFREKKQLPTLGMFLTILQHCGKDKSLHSFEIVAVCKNQFSVINNDDKNKPKKGGDVGIEITHFNIADNGKITPCDKYRFDFKYGNEYWLLITENQEIWL